MTGRSSQQHPHHDRAEAATCEKQGAQRTGWRLRCSAAAVAACVPGTRRSAACTMSSSSSSVYLRSHNPHNIRV